MAQGNRHYWFGTLLCICLTRGDAGVVMENATMAPSLAVPIESALEEGLAIDWPQLERLYDSLQQRYIWHRDGRLTEKGRQLFRWLAAADEEGLDPADYHVDRLGSLIHNPSGTVSFKRELLLSDAYLRLARDLRLGRYDPQSLDPLWMLPREDFDPVAGLAEALSAGRLDGFLDGLRPQSGAYRKLKAALAKYRAIQSAGGWISLQVDRPLRPGDTDPGVATLRERLAAEQRHEVATVAEPNHFDADLADEVRLFQRRHGLLADGVVGPATLAALNEPIERRIAQIRVNLERWRWLPHELEPRYLMVNTAGFEIMLMSEGREVFHKRTVNGREERQTPSFSSRVTHLVSNPQWTVPRSIAVEDMLPRQQRDRGYLTSRRIRVYARFNGSWDEIDPVGIPWENYHENNFPFVLIQDAGMRNSLGRIKFHMPNSYQIFLHDTPAPVLFERPNRAFSSGCIRVEAADLLARLLLDYGEQSQNSRWQQTLRNGETEITPLARPMPIYLAYFTSWVDASGNIHFRPDIYHRNTTLLLAVGEEVKHVNAKYLGRAAYPAL
jgi:murein L,D-transpeptidase YcbB/YkuD